MYVVCMGQLRFDWDPAKAAANLRKHGVSFDEARTVFEDAEGLIIPDLDRAELVSYFSQRRP